MNDKEKLLRDYARMCIRGKCDECRIGEKCNFNCGEWIAENPKEAIQIIEQWAAEHPVKTRQGEFLKLFPNAVLDDNGILCIKPCEITRNPYDQPSDDPDDCVFALLFGCLRCRYNYWSQEVTK